MDWQGTNAPRNQGWGFKQQLGPIDEENRWAAINLFTDSEVSAMSWNGKPEAESVTDLKMEA